MSIPIPPDQPPPDDSIRLEAVTVSVGFDDVLDITLALNHGQVDTMIVVTSFEDKKTQAVCRKHGARCVQTDLFTKNGRHFNKGAAINAGMAYFQWNGWRAHIDSDIILPDNFRRVLFNHTHLHKNTLYGCDRVDIIGPDELKAYLVSRYPDHYEGVLMQAQGHRQIGSRIISNLYGYLPLGFFQLWHAHTQKEYPYSLGTAAHDDMMFAALWPRSHRQHLPSIVVYHLCMSEPVWGQNWDKRRSPRFVR